MTRNAKESSLERGTNILREALKTIPVLPGIYRMLDAEGTVLYVGKARHLKHRVTSYTHSTSLSYRIARMVSQIHAVEITVTETEAQALLLEANLIKKLKPRYNILLRDDKSFPFIHLSSAHEFPRIAKHRGAHTAPGEYFGPFASASAVNQTLAVLQRAFLLRPCTDNIFRNRSRPCLQYQIKRCSAPCVGYISQAEYSGLIDQARAFLSGKSREIQQALQEAMYTASSAEDYETAALLRDRIRALTQVQQEGRLRPASFSDGDVIALHREGEKTCIQLLFFRAGQHFGGNAYFPLHAKDDPDDAVLASFLAQFYQRHTPPKLILTSLLPEDRDLLEEALQLRTGYKVAIVHPQRGEKASLVEQAMANARLAMARRLSERANQRELLERVASIFHLDTPPERIEVYDNSHISGSHAVGGMIVAGSEGFEKKHYRKFTIRDEDITGGDDYGMLREVLTRRFSRLQKEDPDRKSEKWPSLVLIDGGAGQLSVAEAVLEELGISSVPLVAIAKGPKRNAGREQFFLPGQAPFQLPPDDAGLHYLQRLRDEAHRFAIGAHRTKRSRAIQDSPLDAVPGIGATRKKALLHHFGSAQAVERASLSELTQVEGISKKMAQSLYHFFNS